MKWKTEKRANDILVKNKIEGEFIRDVRVSLLYYFSYSPESNVVFFPNSKRLIQFSRQWDGRVLIAIGDERNRLLISFIYSPKLQTLTHYLKRD